MLITFENISDKKVKIFFHKREIGNIIRVNGDMWKPIKGKKSFGSREKAAAWLVVLRKIKPKTYFTERYPVGIKKI